MPTRYKGSAREARALDTFLKLTRAMETLGALCKKLGLSLKSIEYAHTEIVHCLLRTADDLGTPGVDPVYGHGRLNAARAVASCP